jgi:hypothetical protein
MSRKKCKMSEHYFYLLLTKNVTNPKQNEFLKELKFEQRHKKKYCSVAIKKNLFVLEKLTIYLVELLAVT